MGGTALWFTKTSSAKYFEVGFTLTLPVWSYPLFHERELWGSHSCFITGVYHPTLKTVLHIIPSCVYMHKHNTSPIYPIYPTQKTVLHHCIPLVCTCINTTRYLTLCMPAWTRGTHLPLAALTLAHASAQAFTHLLKRSLRRIYNVNVTLNRALARSRKVSWSRAAPWMIHAIFRARSRYLPMRLFSHAHGAAGRFLHG